MHKRPAAGQASTEYIAAIALIAAILVLAAPAVGAPDLGKAVVGQMRLALCLVANDVCSPKLAARAGLAPCPLRSKLTGHEVTATAFSIELGHRLTLTVTPNSDGTVAVVRSAGGIAGLAGGVGADVSKGPLTFEAGATAGVRARVQAAFGWQFPDQATADRFLEHALLNGLDLRRWPATWHSVEGSEEVAGMVGAALGGREHVDLVGVAGGGHAAIGARLTADHRFVTVYGRLAVDGPELSFPLAPPIGLGRQDWVVEYTHGREGPRELAFRTASASDMDTEVSETVMRLDLRDPANRAIARPLLDVRMPWGATERAVVEAVARRIATHGTIERTVSVVDEDSRGVSGSVRGGAKFGGAFKRITVRKQLISATARTGGPERERFDCQPGLR